MVDKKNINKKSHGAQFETFLKVRFKFCMKMRNEKCEM